MPKVLPPHIMEMITGFLSRFIECNLKEGERPTPAQLETVGNGLTMLLESLGHVDIRVGVVDKGGFMQIDIHSKHIVVKDSEPEDGVASRSVDNPEPWMMN